MFWNEFREKFEGTPVWEMHSNLMKAVVLEMLQNDFLLYVDSTKDLVWDIEEEDEDKRRKAVENIFLRKLVKTFADKHKDSIYTKKWHATSLNHKSGKEALADFFQKIRDGKSVTNSGIYTGQI
jgi:nicotinamidase-related amidase